MEEVYSAADFAIARAGAASLAELRIFALPAILIPYPYAADDHQTRNAEIFVRGGRGDSAEGIGIVGRVARAERFSELIDRPGNNFSECRKTPLALAPEKCGRTRGRETMEKYTQPHDAVAA